MWEYYVENIERQGSVSASEITKRLNELGSNGWELVCIDSLGRYIFKRRK